MNGHVVDALLRLFFDHFEHHADGQILGAADAGKRFINRHRADRHRRRLDDRFANHRDITASGKIHHRIRAVMHGAVKFFQLFAYVRSSGGVADVRVDLAAECDADAHRLEVGVMNVGGNDGTAASDFIANHVRRDFFAQRHVLHLFGDDALRPKCICEKFLAPPFIAACAFQSTCPSVP